MRDTWRDLQEGMSGGPEWMKTSKASQRDVKDVKVSQTTLNKLRCTDGNTQRTHGNDCISILQDHFKGKCSWS